MAFSWVMILPLLFATALNPLNSAMLATALVAIDRAFPGDFEMGAWLVASLYLTASIAQPVLGTFADRFGARRILLWSSVFLGIGGLFGAIAEGPQTLIASRVLIALGTSGAYPCSVSIIRQRASDAGVSPPARLLGYLAIVSAVAVSIGPPIGGFLTAWLGWRSIFSVNLPLSIAVILTIKFMVPPDKDQVQAGSPIDWLGITLFTLFMSALVVFFMHLQVGFDAASLLVAVVAFVALLIAERNHARPFVDLALLGAKRPLALTYVNCFAFSFANYCVFYSVPQWSQAWLGLPLAMSGFVLMPVAVSSTIGTLAPTIGRAGYIVELTGICLLALTSLALLQLDQESTLLQVMSTTFLFGGGYGVLNMSNQQRLLDYAPIGQSGSAAGLLRTATYCGAILSAPLVAFLMTGHPGSQPMHTLALLILPLSLVPLSQWIIDVRRGRVQGSR